MTVAAVDPPVAAPSEKSVAVPVSETDCGLGRALSAIVSVAERVPVADGVKLKFTVQLALGLTVPPVAGHVPPLIIAKSPPFAPETDILVMDRLALPELVNVTDCDVLVVPTICPGKLTGDAGSDTAGPTPDPVSVTM